MTNEKWSQQEQIFNIDNTTRVCVITGSGETLTNNIISPNNLGLSVGINPYFTGTTSVNGGLSVTGNTLLNGNVVFNENIENNIIVPSYSDSDWSSTGTTNDYRHGWTISGDDPSFNINSNFSVLSSDNMSISILYSGTTFGEHQSIVIYIGNTLIGYNYSGDYFTGTYYTNGASGIISISSSGVSCNLLQIVNISIINTNDKSLFTIIDAVSNDNIFELRNQKNTSNLFIGNHRGINFKNGDNNIAIGNYSNSVSDQLTFGDSNILIGNGNVNSTLLDNSIIIGIGSYPYSNNNSNEIIIGNNIVGRGNNTVIIGDSSVTGTTLQGHVTPYYPSSFNLGSGSNQWNNLYLVNSPVVSSDERIKTAITGFTQNEINAATALSKEIGTYKFLAAIREKGENDARIHIGMTVQNAMTIMTNNGLDPLSYSFICHDVWPEEIVTHLATKDKEAWIETIPAGDLYSFRYTELLLFIGVGFEERLTALESK